MHMYVHFKQLASLRAVAGGEQFREASSGSGKEGEIYIYIYIYIHIYIYMYT